MKQDIHPTYYNNVTVTCACGNKFVTGATVESIQIEICAACHPFFTGKSKLIDTAGRVDKFKERLARAATLKTSKKELSTGKLIKNESQPKSAKAEPTKERIDEE